MMTLDSLSSSLEPAAVAKAALQRPSLLESLEFLGLGLAIVMLALSGIYVVTALVGAVFQYADRRRELAAGSEAPEPASAPVDVAEEAPPVAVIAAAVATVLEAPHRIIAVHPEPGTGAWVQEGRHRHFESHHVR